ncbi:hypothetical protein ACIGW0_27415 [Streptomyces bikiniensis]|uniref:EF-hand domain-containing protein n=1 Tax=Streptomyces bikiniensis TaxID=1896 RepID=A0ABW8D3C5_STRBI
MVDQRPGTSPGVLTPTTEADDRVRLVFSLFDADGDGRISPEEFTAVVLDPRRFDAAVNGFADALSAPRCAA